MRSSTIVSPGERKRIADAIREAESRSAGEIRVRIVGACIGEPRRCALRAFRALRVDETRDRSGVLIFVALSRRRIELVADEGISARVPQETWDALVAALGDRFRAGEFADGLIAAIEEIGSLLASHFPRRADDRNELSDEPSLG